MAWHVYFAKYAIMALGWHSKAPHLKKNGASTTPNIGPQQCCRQYVVEGGCNTFVTFSTNLMVVGK